MDGCSETLEKIVVNVGMADENKIKLDKICKEHNVKLVFKSFK